MPPAELSRAPLAVPVVLELAAPPALPQPQDAAMPAQTVVDEDVDQASSAQLSESWSEFVPDFFVPPAAVEAAKASADEGPGPWPPVIPDDPVDATPAAPRATSDAPRASARRPTIRSLTRFLRQLKTRRRRAVSEYP